MNIFIYITGIGGLVGLIFMEEEILLAFYHILSYLSIVLAMIFVVSVSFLYEFCINSVIYTFNPSFVHEAKVKFKLFVDSNLLFNSTRIYAIYKL